MNTALEKCSDRFIETLVDGEVVVMELESGEFFSLTGTALSAWQLIDGERDREELIAMLSAEYAMDTDRIAPEVDAFLADLTGAGLVRVN